MAENGSKRIWDLEQDGIDPSRSDGEKETESVKSLPTYKAGNADPFGDEEFAEVKYKVMSWWQCGMSQIVPVMIAETISLGILSLPSAVAALGLVPAVIIIVGLGLLATYTGYVIGQFKMRYPHVHNMADAGEILFGRIGREVLGGAQVLFLVFIMGSHVLTFSVMMNVLTEHGTSFISIFAAVMITMVAIGIQRPGRYVDATVHTGFYHAFIAVTNIVFAYAGHVAFFGFISELKEPAEYPKALYLLQITNTILYTVTAVVIYRYGGKDVASPALGSTGPIVRKVAYGVAIPTIVIAGVINGHVAVKYIYVRLFRGTEHMSKRNLLSIGTWVGLATILWVFAWIIAEAIPVFNNLLSLIVSCDGIS
ncbi:hypothetical protein PRK78_005781 [Emydomyces testavorans]|uniref:Amino acid transporter transmembrane domain-containing protein n=1 Tax=Emydomyces testavorans TaxID=2070801 RepID=A0AAF0IL22_9EURO|nr:hypothetical protein PRK78_005781 [Emydomyces testavorans]